MIISIVLFFLFLLSRFLLRITKRNHAKDPVYQEEKRKMEEERRRRIEKENEDLRRFELLNEEYSDLDYSDDEYQIPYGNNNETEQ